MGVVKSDGYGHGLIPVSRTLEQSGVDCLGVAHLQEALELRDAGLHIPVVVLCGIRTSEEARIAVLNDLTPVLFDLQGIELLAKESKEQNKKTRFHLKVDTGMGRLGVAGNEVASIVNRIREYNSIELEALTSHLSSADEASGDFTETQIRRFEEAIETCRSMGLELPLNNLANSAGLTAYRRSHFDMVRPGIMLYGGLPSPGFYSDISLRPAMHFKAAVVQVRELPGHTPVSYGRRYYTSGPRKLAILSAGYGDGLPRSMSNRGYVLIHEKNVPIVGTICMNLTVSDITGIEGVKPGDEAVFLGTQGEQTITGDDMATWADTISYEVFCSIGQRNKRSYIS